MILTLNSLCDGNVVEKEVSSSHFLRENPLWRAEVPYCLTFCHCASTTMFWPINKNSEVLVLAYSSLTRDSSIGIFSLGSPISPAETFLKQLIQFGLFLLAAWPAAHVTIFLSLVSNLLLSSFCGAFISETDFFFLTSRNYIFRIPWCLVLFRIPCWFFYFIIYYLFHH